MGRDGEITQNEHSFDGEALSDQLVFRPVPSRNAFEETVERIAHAIKLGVIGRGDRLPPERELAPKLGVSRVTLREAIRALAQAGYVESKRGRSGGTFVIHRPKHAPSQRNARRIAREMGEEAVLDALKFRGVVEAGTAELASANADAEARARLMPLAEEAEHVAAADYRPADTRFHMAIAEVADSPSLSAAVADAQLRLTDLLAAIPRLEPAIRHANDQHRRIAEAIAAGDGAAAREAMEEHVAATATLIRGFLA